MDLPPLIAVTILLRLLALFFLLIIAVSLLPLRFSPPRAQRNPFTQVTIAVTTPRRGQILIFLSLIGLTFVADGGVLVSRAVLSHSWDWDDASNLQATIDVVGLVVFSLVAIFGSWKDLRGVDVWGRRRLRYFVFFAIILELVNVVVVATSGVLKDGGDIYIPELPKLAKILFSPFLPFGISVFRLLLLIPLYFFIKYPYKRYIPATDIEPASNSLLLPPEAASAPSTGLSPTSHSGYGTFQKGQPPSTIPSRSITPPPGEAGPSKKPPRKKAEEPEPPEPTFREMFKRLKKLFPYLWPYKHVGLQFLAVLAIIIVLIGRFVNIGIPVSLKAVVSALEKQRMEPRPSPWKPLFFYVGFRFLAGSGGLGSIRDMLWAPVMQYSDRQMSQLSFDHLLNLSLAFHTRRKTGEVLRILDRGAAINHIFEMILFTVIPTILDMFLALAVFVYYFDWMLTSVIFAVMVAYVTASITITSWRTRLRRQMNDKDVITRGIHTDCLLNYETVKYFGGEEHEGERYRKAIQDYQVLEFKVMASANLMSLVQNFIISLGLLVGSLMVAAQIANHQGDASDFIFFITYLAQLYAPLNMLSYIYRSLNQSLIDTEKLLKLLDEPTEVNDQPNAPDILVTKGEIKFENVTFSYDDRATALNGVSFTVPAGQSVALVGESGSGKSTILRLLYRFYDLKDGEGRILIDGQDIRDVTQASLRRAIGVVPQDSVLFNASIEYNVGYGKFGAAQEEIEAASRAAQMHDRILGFPDGYETKVGERGVRLSGGEKQRVSIARTYLKNAPILLLDEATSALDTTTEKDIQKALQELAHGRSSLSIAHRLSTIANSDIILVLKDGQIIESGSHAELLAQNGVFAAMWEEQISAEGSPRLITSEIETKPTSTTEGFVVGETSEAPIDESVYTPGPLVSDPPEDTSGEADDKIAPSETALTTSDGAPYAQIAAKKPSTIRRTSIVDTLPKGVDVAFPSAGDDTSSVVGTLPSTHTQGVSFAQASVDPSRAPSEQESIGTKDSEQKRRRISSQNFQRLAKRISFGAVSAKKPDASTLVASPSEESPAEITRRATSLDQSDIASPSSSPAVKFPESVDSPPSRPGTPDASGKSKTGVQNLQRLARRISLGGRKGSSSGSDFAGLVERVTPKREGSFSSFGFGRTSKDKDQSPSAADDDSASRRNSKDKGKEKK